MPKKNTSKDVWLIAAILGALALSLPALAPASPQSRQLILMGHADMESGKYEGALQKFHAASQADAGDSEAFYFGGAALNRLGRFDEALQLLERASAMGFRGVGLTFDTGWALLRLGRWADAAAQLEHFERLVSGRGKTSEFLGQAYLGLMQYDRAEVKLKEAIEREPNLKPMALLHLSVLERSRNNPSAAEGYVQTIMQESPDSPIAQALKSHREAFTASKRKTGKSTY
ncbi:MAG: tetratricopeptide repeat protein [Candidatus Binatia bacterium]